MSAQFQISLPPPDAWRREARTTLISLLIKFLTLHARYTADRNIPSLAKHRVCHRDRRLCPVVCSDRSGDYSADVKRSSWQSREHGEGPHSQNVEPAIKTAWSISLCEVLHFVQNDSSLKLFPVFRRVDIDLAFRKLKLRDAFAISQNDRFRAGFVRERAEFRKK